MRNKREKLLSVAQSHRCGAFLFLLFLLLCTSCGEEKREKYEPQHYQTTVVSRKDMELERQFSARLTGRQIVEVRPQVSGCITSILTDEGEAVRKGQTLFIIDQVPFRAALEVAVAARKTAEARLATAKMNYENEARLLKENVVSSFSVENMQNAMFEAEAAVAQAKAQEINARNNLSYTEVACRLSCQQQHKRAVGNCGGRLGNLCLFQHQRESGARPHCPVRLHRGLHS